MGIRTTTLALLIALLLTLPMHVSALLRLRPENAIAIFYKAMKKLNFQGLLPYTKGPEHARLKKTVERMRLLRTTYWDLKRQADTLSGYKVHRIRYVYDDVAVVDYSWKIRVLVPVRNKGNQKRYRTTLKRYQVILFNLKKHWYIVSTRPWSREAELGLGAYYKPKKKKADGKG